MNPSSLLDNFQFLLSPDLGLESSQPLYQTYYCLIYLPNIFNDCILLYDLSQEIAILIDPIIINPESQLTKILEELAIKENPVKLILFDNLLKIELGICKQMIKLGLEFVVFSNDSNPNKKFELTNCPLTNENGLLSNRNGHYVEYFERIEVLNKIPKKSKDFDGFNFLVESQAFYGRFSLYDKQQTEIRYKRLEEFLKEFENLPGILLDYNEEIMKANKSFTEIGDFIGLFEDFNKVKKMKKINCTFEYFFEKYVLNI